MEVVVLEFLLEGVTVEVQSLVPVVPGDDAGLPGDAFQRGRGSVVVARSGSSKVVTGSSPTARSTSARR
ncbi:hypothetical protein [Ornithinimicrobium flavum]|uniref:hypothetical protein n=1 Tax=Ornithinimicrobium flavum TaxID=1288636 RepID=UPI00106F6143|nr:hypothetical protein [Ornithinimicrobium flavum]